jgi:hypothetical protein
MGEQPFVYDAKAVADLVPAMSTPRFGTYLQAAGTEERALQLYKWSTAVAAAFYAPLQTLEVTMRNAIHDATATGKSRVRPAEGQSARWCPEGSAGSTTRHDTPPTGQATHGR